MLIFIDESGDPGFKVEKGSSKYFVVCLVIFDDVLDAEETALEIKKLRRSLNKRDKFEFKFNKCGREYRIRFLETVKNCRFRIRAIVFDKEKIYSLHLRGSKDSFYNYSVKTVLEHNNETISNAKVRLDGLGERTFRQSLTSYLRKNLNSKSKIVMKNLKFQDSKDNVLIQLADMVAGTIRKSYDLETQDCGTYLKIIKRRIDDLWEFK